MSDSGSSLTSNQRLRTEPLVGLAALASGAALVICIFIGASLALMLFLLGTAAILTVWFKWLKTEPNRRPVLKAQLITGLISGVAATAPYDFTRLLLTQLGQLSFYPFETFNIFGQLIIGEGLPRFLTFTIGALYHLCNGVSFAISYNFLLGGKHWAYGVMCAFGLEAAMLTIYPGWLDLEAVMQEFIAVSVFGHIAYGIALGVISQRRLISPS